MTAAEAQTPPTAATTTEDAWTAQFDEMKARFPKVREPIVMAAFLLQQDPDITDDDAKARAAVHGVRITAASINGGRNLLAKQDGAPTSTGTRPAAHRTRAAAAAADPEALIRGVVDKLNAHAATDAEKLRAAMRKAIGVLQTAVDA